MLLKLDKYEIKYTDNKYKFVITSFSLLSQDKHLTFGSPVDVNEAIKKRKTEKQNDKQKQDKSQKTNEALEEMYKEDLKEFLGAAPSSSQAEILASVDGKNVFEYTNS